MKFIVSFYLTKAIETSKRISTSKRIHYPSLIIILLFLVISSGCIEKGQKGWVEIGPYDMVGDHVEVAGNLAVVVEQKCHKGSIYNGSEGKHYDDIKNLQNINGKIAYNAMRNGKWMIIYDWNESGMQYDSIEKSIDIGGKLAYYVKKNGKNLIVYDGKEIGTQYDRVSSYFPVDVGNNLAYIAEKNGTNIIVHNGKEIGTQYDTVWSPVDIGGNLTYKAKKDGYWFIVSNGKEMKGKYQNIEYIMEIGGNLTYIARNGSNYVLVNDGKEERISGSVWGFMDIGGKIAYLVTDSSNKNLVVYDGNKGKPYDSILHFKDVYGKPAYWVNEDRKRFIVYDGKEMGTQYIAVGEDFTGINGTLVYTTFKGDGAQFIVYGDKEIGKQYDYAGNPSNVSGRLAYIARKNNKAFFVYDGEEIGAENNYNDVKDLVEINGKKVYKAAKDGKWFIVMEKYKGLIEPYQIVGLNKAVEENKSFLLVEEWHNTEGHIISGNRSDIPFRAIDFPMYYIQEGTKKIRVPFIQDNLKCLSNVNIIVGYGNSLEGDIGMGINSYLNTYEGFPLHINRSGYSIDIISNDRVLINNSIEIPPGGQHLFISNYTINYGNTTVQIQHTIRIKNYGNYPKDSFYT